MNRQTITALEMVEFIVGDFRRREITLTAPDAASAELATRIYSDDASDDGIVPAAWMAAYFPGQPELHKATRLSMALMHAGCVEASEPGVDTTTEEQAGPCTDCGTKCLTDFFTTFVSVCVGIR